MRYISSANIACGWHAGDPMTMEKTIELAKLAGVAIGAHPGFNDLMGFGRRELRITPEEMTAYVKYQIGSLQALCKSHGCHVEHVKPHGAMYNMAAKDPKYAFSHCQSLKGS